MHLCVAFQTIRKFRGTVSLLSGWVWLSHLSFSVLVYQFLYLENDRVGLVNLAFSRYSKSIKFVISVGSHLAEIGQKSTVAR